MPPFDWSVAKVIPSGMSFDEMYYSDNSPYYENNPDKIEEDNVMEDEDVLDDVPLSMRISKKGKKRKKSKQTLTEELDELEDVPLSIRLFTKKSKVTSAGRPKRSAVEKREDEAVLQEDVKEIKKKRRKKLRKDGGRRVGPKLESPISYMIMRILRKSKDRRGTSFREIKKILSEKYKCNVKRNHTLIKKFVQNAVDAGVLFRINGIGLQGSFRLCTRVPVNFPVGERRFKLKRRNVKTVFLEGGGVLPDDVGEAGAGAREG